MYTDTDNRYKIPFGVPFIELNSNALVPLRGYDNLQSKKKLSFVYKVGVGEETPQGEQLDIVPYSSIELNGGSIVAEGSGLDFNQSSMPQPGEEGFLFSMFLCMKVGDLFLLRRIIILSHGEQNIHRQSWREVSTP
jgi:hypothetical protein